MRGLRSGRTAATASVLVLSLAVIAVGAAQFVQADSGKAVAAKKCKRKHRRKKCRQAPPPATSTPGGGSTTLTTPPVVQYPLAVTAETGGSVFSSPSGISCPMDCSESYDAGQLVYLNAQADLGFVFTGWNGDCSVDPCSVTMNGPRSVSASFIAGHTLTVTLQAPQFPPDDDGSVVSSPAGISCSRTGGQANMTCSTTYLVGTPVTLTASPEVPISSAGRIKWGGDCAGTPDTDTTCDLTMDADHSVTMSFTET